jgi:hypothetical protein
MMIELPIDRGERLLWSGRPDPLPYTIRVGRHAFLFGLVFFGFSLFWTHGAMTEGAKVQALGGVPFWLLGVPFVIVGACLVLSPFWHFYRALRTTYALTDKRALTAISGPYARRFSVPLSQIRFVDVRPSDDGSGDIYFKETVVSDSEGQTTRREGFIAISELDRVDQLLRKTIERPADADRQGPHS